MASTPPMRIAAVVDKPISDLPLIEKTQRVWRQSLVLTVGPLLVTGTQNIPASVSLAQATDRCEFARLAISGSARRE